MGQPVSEAGRQEQRGALIEASVAYDGDSACIAQARAFTREFLTRVQAVAGLPVSGRVMGMVPLVVSELVTNAVKYSGGPCLLSLEVDRGAVRTTVWDSDPTLPIARAAEAGRVGQHGLEIVMAVCQAFEVHREPVGKRITAVVTLTDPPNDEATGPLI
ncbi:ATP-binding protein [Streptomyces sp. NPDC002580]|uniref:ATP-binding protein n=1 Tax=Streptomyces sp. NPDC002580 TaxID=3364653 RepID=UPI0036A3C093